MKKAKWYLLGVGFCLIAFQNCSGVGFQQEADSQATSIQSTNPPSSCVLTPTTSVEPAKFIFLVDTSGSNDGGGGTDDGKVWRNKVLKAFVSDYETDPGVYFNLANFSGSSAQSLMNTSGFTQDVNVIANAMSKFSGIQDASDTPYQQAIDYAKSVIMKDPDFKAAVVPHYIVVMITDGLPSGTNDNPTAQDTANLVGYVQSLVALSPAHITFNSVYYYKNSSKQAVISELQKMAAAGGGQFTSANTNSGVFDVQNTVTTALCK